MSYNIKQSVSSALSMPKGSTAAWGPNDAPILIVLGQSNSYGHATTLAAGDQVTTGYTNVFTLDRTASSNALYATNVTTSSIAWTGMTTLGKHNIGTSSSTLGAQDHTCNAANQFAKLWQQHITSGNSMGLPNLYVVLMGWGSQGIDPSLSASGVDRWNPARSTTDVESMYPRAIRTLSSAIENLRAAGKNPRILAVQWNQWESEAGFTDLAALNSAMNFLRIKAGINDALGTNDAPWRFFWPLSTTYTAARTLKVQKAITSVIQSDPINTTLIDTRLAPHYTGVSPAFGVFGGDNVHYNATTHQWFAQYEWNNIVAGFKGVPVPVIQSRVPAFLQSTASAVTVVNDLTTGGTTSALSAEQGKILSASMPKILSWAANEFVSGVVANSTSTQLSSLPFKSTSGYVYQLNAQVEPNTGKKMFIPSAISGTGTNGGQVLMVANATPTDGKFGYFEWDQVGNPSVSVCLAVKSRTAVNTYNTLGYGYFALWIDSMYTGKPIYNGGVTAAGTTHDTGTPFAMLWDLANLGAGNANIKSMTFTGTPTAGVYSGIPSLSTALNTAKPLVTGWPMTSVVRWRAGLLSANSGTLTVEWYDTTTSTWKVAIQQQNMNTVRTAGNNFDAGQLGLLYGMSSTANNSVANMNIALSGARMTNISFVSQD
jgi:hypothetical protein